MIAAIFFSLDKIGCAVTLSSINILPTDLGGISLSMILQATSLSSQNFDITNFSPATSAGPNKHTMIHMYTEVGIKGQLIQVWIIGATIDTQFGSDVSSF